MRKWLLWFFCLGLGIFLIFCLSEIFSGNWVLPQSFSIGPLTIHYYGLTMALAVAGGFFVAVRRAKKYGLNDASAENILFWIAIGGFIGARLYHVASSYEYYAAHPADILKVWNGGLSIYGAMLGGFLTLWIYKRVISYQLSIINYLDWLTPSLILGQIIGRFGNLFNYEAYGYPTNLPWKMFVPLQFRPEPYLNNNFFHPFFLYEILGNLVILIIIFSLEKLKVGRLFLWYLLLYNTLRFALEFLRTDSVFIGAIRQNAVVSLILVVVSAAGLIIYRNHAQTS